MTLVVNGANIDVNGGFVACGTTAGVSSIVVNASLLADVENQTVTITDGAAASRPRSRWTWAPGTTP